MNDNTNIELVSWFAYKGWSVSQIIENQCFHEAWVETLIFYNEWHWTTLVGNAMTELISPMWVISNLIKKHTDSTKMYGVAVIYLQPT